MPVGGWRNEGQKETWGREGKRQGGKERKTDTGLTKGRPRSELEYYVTRSVSLSEVLGFGHGDLKERSGCSQVT